MKNLLIMGGVGVGLFGATVVGLLGMQGRLNHEGTAGIPVLNSFFPPEEKPEGEEGVSEGDGGAHKDGADGHGKEGKDGHGESGAKQDTGKAAGHAEHRDQGHPEKPEIEYVEGKSIKEADAPKDDGHGGGHGGDAHGDEGHGKKEKKKLEETPRRPDEKTPEEKKQDELKRRFDRQRDWLHSTDNRYRGPGDLFQMPRIKAGMSVSEVNSVVARAQAMMKDVERKQAVLEEDRRNLRIRERDIADRQARVSKLINEVEARRTKLQQATEEFNKRFFYLQPQEEAALKETARIVGGLAPDKAKDLILSYWRTPEGQEKAIKILKVMDREQVDQIIAQMETQTMREILEKRMVLIKLDTAKK